MIDRFDLTDHEMDESPEEMVTKAFSRCQNWPEERIGVIGLAQGLKKAADKFDIPMQSIVDRCAELSRYCPTDADLLSVSREMREAIKRATEVSKPEEWKLKYGDPKPFDWTKIDTDMVKQVKEREKALLAAIKAKYPRDLSWPQMATAAEELGYHDYAKAWRRGIVGGGN